ncbi:hypothetical protein PVK06_030011 [Gossypium arboreum]|uniref:Retrotransposon gag domain-containing protein n=1 Tax=Gossypium arboreum TaxID=29729 RepID=A0ABR0NM48_GOSAR|nr:hypothetical protein PVK06_030011 [Gossypium arboreum]
MEVPNVPFRMNLVDMGSVNLRNHSPVTGVSDKASRLECPKFDGSDFRGWWTKLEQYFEAEAIPEASKDRFGFGQFDNPMKELVNLKQQGTVEQFQDMFVDLLNHLHLLESYALSIFLSNLKPEISHYLDLFERSTLMEAFQLVRKIELFLFGLTRKSSTPLHNSPRTLLSPSAMSGYSPSSTRMGPVSQSLSNALVSKSGTRPIPLAVLVEHK